MSVPVITFSSMGSGKTFLAYHMAWMLSDIGYRVLVVDLDPQADLTSYFLGEDELERIWVHRENRGTVWRAVRHFEANHGDDAAAALVATSDERLALLAGHPGLASFEDDLGDEWRRGFDGVTSFRRTTALWRVLHESAKEHGANAVLVDVGSNLGAVNRAALIASDHVVIPMPPDIYSLAGLSVLGPALREWRTGWRRRLGEYRRELGEYPRGDMAVTGYVVLQHGVRLDRPAKAYRRWLDRIPGEFRSAVLNEEGPAPGIDADKNCLGQLKHYHSLTQMAQEARKPIFALTGADGAFGGHFQAARDSYTHFRRLAETLIARIGGV